MFGDSLPGGFLLQPGDTGYVEHNSKEEQRLIAKLVQLLLEGFLQLHPTLGRGLGLSLEPQTEVMGLKQDDRWREGQCGTQRDCRVQSKVLGWENGVWGDEEKLRLRREIGNELRSPFGTSEENREEINKQLKHNRHIFLLQI